MPYDRVNQVVNQSQGVVILNASSRAARDVLGRCNGMRKEGVLCFVPDANRRENK